MSHPPSEPDREQRQRVTPEPVWRVELFSHPAEPEMFAHHRPANGDDWQATLCSGGAAESAELYRRVALDER